MSFILFDVGANNGHDSLEKTKNDPTIQTWAFEPVPHLYQGLIDSSSGYANRYRIYPLAISDYDGESTFYCATTKTGLNNGASSLYPFVNHLNETWPGRDDLRTEKEITVKVSRLDTWYKENNLNLDKIDFFHCDTQGSDLRVLKGMGDLINLIQLGVVECARDEQAKLYAENHTVEEMKDFLNDHGFEIIRQEPNDPWSNELNLFFRKKT